MADNAKPSVPVVGEADSFPHRDADDVEETLGLSLTRRAVPLRAKLRGFLTGGEFSAHIILGFRLRPYSFWHAALLDWALSPLVGHVGSLDVTALYVGARICQMRYPHMPQRGLADNYIREILCLKKFWLRNAEQLRLFLSYLADYNARPEYGATAESEPASAPWYLYQVAQLRRLDPALTEAQAWDTPVGKGSWLIAGALEAHGSKVNLLTPQIRHAFTRADAKQRARNSAA